MEGGPSIQTANDDIDSVADGEDASNTGCGHNFCHPRGTMHRFIALLFMCFLGFGSYFCYDNPAALEDHFKQDLNMTTTKYTLLYAMYAWPNVVLCFVGGFLIDRVFGIALGTSIYMGFTLIGQLMFALAVFYRSFAFMCAGRFVFGIGAESLAVAQNNYAVVWFKGKELNMVFGLQMSFARIGSTVNFLVMESVYEWVTVKYQGAEGLGIALFIAASTCILSMLCALILGVMDKRAERILQRNANSGGEVVSLMDIKDFKYTFWLISIICVSYYIAIFPFIGLGKGFFTTKYHMTNQEANSLTGLIYLISGIASPFLGFLIDKTGKNVLWILTATAVTIACHAILAFTYVDPHVGVIMMGVAYSCLASGLWPLVSLIVPERQLGTAYGVCQSVQNLGLAVFTIVAGNIEEKYGYTMLEVFFISSLGVSFLSIIILWLSDMKNGVLNMTPAERIRHEMLTDSEKDALLRDGALDEADSYGALHPGNDFQIRNRYLSRIGAPLPDHYSIQHQGLSYRPLR